MARLDFKLPDIGEGIAEAEIVGWHAEVGQPVSEGQVIASVMTDKATVEMEAPEDGTLIAKGGEVGDMLAVGTTLFVLERAAGGPDSVEEPVAVSTPPRPPETLAPPPPSTRKPAPAGAKVLASPAVRQRAKALGIDLAQVPAQGDRVRHEDLDRHLLSSRPGPAPAAAGEPLPVPENAREVRVVGLRRQIARRMEDAKRHIPHFTYVEEIDVTRLERLRQTPGHHLADEPPLRLLPLLCVEVCKALRAYPQLNAHYDDARETIIEFGDVHLGIATHTDDGLLVPVLRHADRMDARALAAAIADLAERARAGKLGRDELRGSTFTISSLGKLGGIAATPIINRPEVAILGPNRVIERIAMTPLGSAPRQIMNLSISCDHRVIDGHVAAAFVQELKRLLESPAAG